MSEKMKQNQLKLFNKLFSTLPAVKRMNNDKGILNLEKPITHLYFFHNKDFWFANGETDEKYIYIFGKNPQEADIGESDATLIIDFDKNVQFNDNNLGIFSVEKSELHILINDTLLNKRYPYFNTGDFKIKQLQLLDNNLKLNVIDLGGLNNDFIDNIEKFIKQTPKINQNPNFEETYLKPQNSKKEKLIKKEEKIKTNDTNKCEICSKDKNQYKINSELNNIKNLRPELCGECIEKIVASEFFQKVKPFINSNDSKDLDIAKEKFGDDELFDLGMKLLEKYEIISYIGIKKLFFTLNKDSYLISQYIKYSDKNNLLIDNIFKTKTPSSKKQEKIDVKKTYLTKKTANQMNLFINALNAGKTHEEAYKIAKIDSKKVDNWIKFGKRGDQDYINFYEKYRPFDPKIVERNEKMEIFLDSLKKDANIDNALKKADLSINKVRAWYNLGEKEDENYKDFYLACRILLPNGIPKEESKKIVNNNELINEFIALIEDGNTNADAIEKLKIPKFKVKNWVTQGKLGNKKYVNFYNAYMKEIEKEKQIKESEKQEKISKKQDKIIKNEVENNKTSHENTCKICGRKLNKKTKKDICKRCLRKQYASKIILKLLKSIKPENPFKKEDLKVLGLQNIQITDYIWTLQEFNLIVEKNNKLQLKNKEELEEFIKESGLEFDELPQEEGTVKLNKTCKTCGETLEISKFFTSENTEDGFEDNCKDCKRIITAATYLSEIIEVIPFESEFTEDDLKPHFKNPFQLQAKIWALLDNDLVKKNFENNSYTLTDEKTAKEFLDKYYEEKEDKPIETQNKKPIIEKDPQDYTKEDQMKLIIEAISEGKSRKEAAEIAQIPLYKITHWYNEGRQGYGNDNVNFFKQLKGLEKINLTKTNSLKDRMNTVLGKLRINDDITNISEASETEINEWIEKGKKDIEPYNYFFEKYGNIIVKNREEKENEYRHNEANRKIFLENFKSGKTKEESAKNSELKLSLVHEWYLKGKNNEEPYTEFYEKFIEIKTKKKTSKVPRISKTDKFGTKQTVNSMNIILESLYNGLSETEALEKSKTSRMTYNYWLNRGKQEFGELYIQFYNLINEVKEKNLHNNLDEILTPLPEEYEELFKGSKMSSTGFAWVINNSNSWIYTKWRDGKNISITSKNLVELYAKVKEQNLVWGVRDYKLACESLNILYEPKETQINNNNILAPLPKKYENSFKSTKINKTGIAWVNKVGNQFVYSRQINGKPMTISAETINELHKKVIDNDLVWGIRDYKKASNLIDIPDDFEIPEETFKETPIENNENIMQNTDIYAPLDQKYLETFPQQSNQTGIAWVNKIGNQFIYSRNINGETIKFTDNTIEGLYKQVIDNNQIWGIRNYINAQKFINIPEDFEIPEIFKSKKEKPKINTDIYAPLSEKHVSKFNPNMNNKSGIAWVTKIGNNWIYQRQKNGKQIKFNAHNIHELHKKVITNNQIWGITDYDKARLIIESKERNNKPIQRTTNVTVNYIEKTVNDIEIIIKGNIKNKEILDVLNRLKIFEENFKRIITTTINNQVDIYIELEINKYLLKTFEEKINELNWKINK